MTVTSRRLIDSILVLPNTKLIFGVPGEGAHPLDVVESLRFGDIADIHLTRIGAIGLTFLDSGNLESIEQLDFHGAGLIPEHVTRRKDEIVALQGRRLLFANFVAAALFGRIAALQHTSLTGAVSVGMNDMLAFQRAGDRLQVENTPYTARILGAKATAMPQLGPVPTDQLTNAAAFTSGLAQRAAEFSYANLQVCMAMNYQAAVLHHAQHAPASFAINFSVAEALVKEIFHAYGLVGTASAQAFATRTHGIATMSNNAFRKKTMSDQLALLETGGLIDAYLEQRLQAARVQRNDLMHGAIPVDVTQSGPLQTMVRDLWALLLEGPFELTAGYTMRW
ncbi:MAG: hypothetical protein V4574_14095 [Pseudomonadota bacterium]